MQTKTNIFDECKIWLDATKFKRAHIFGSLIHVGGIQFQKDRSDVDIVGQFQEEIECRDRTDVVLQALAPTKQLNLRLLAELNRANANDPITSVVPVLPRELELGVHKGGSKDFFSHNLFECIDSGQSCHIGKTMRHRSSRMEGVFEALKGAQSYRNKYLSVAPSGLRSVEAFSGLDSLPKELSRAAAQVRWARETKAVDDQRFDINEGQIYILQLVAARRNQHRDFEDLFKLLAIRMGGRGESPSITAEQQVLLWEMVADDALAVIPPAESATQFTQKTVVPRKSLAPSVKAQLLLECGNRCSYPGCEVPLGENGIAEFAFIRSLSKGGPRFNPDWAHDKYFSPENMVVLCPTHHREIDRHPEQYPASEIVRWKNARSFERVQFNAKNVMTLLRLLLRIADDLL